MELSSPSYRIISELLKERTGQHLTEGRRWRIGTALSGVFRERGISNVDQLVCLLAQQDSEDLAKDVVEALLNNETYFYRDRAMFDLIGREVLPALARKRADTKRISIWSAGCSTGQEPLSLAMIIHEQRSSWTDWTFDILGTDISEKAIAAARAGSYTQFEIQRGLGMTQMIDFFDEQSGGWKADDRLRQMIRYEVHNVTEPLRNIREFDLVLCRNVLLYFSLEDRLNIFKQLSAAIAPDGLLMLGAGETVVGQTDLFEPVKGHQGLYRPVRLASSSSAVVL